MGLDVLLFILSLTTCWVVYRTLYHLNRLQFIWDCDLQQPENSFNSNRRMNQRTPLIQAIQALDAATRRLNGTFDRHRHYRPFSGCFTNHNNHNNNRNPGCGSYRGSSHYQPRPGTGPWTFSRLNRHLYNQASQGFGTFVRPSPVTPPPEPRPPSSPPRHPRPPPTPPPDSPPPNGPSTDQPPPYDELNEVNQEYLRNLREGQPTPEIIPEEAEGSSGDDDLPELDKIEENPNEETRIIPRPVIKIKKTITRKGLPKAKMRVRRLLSQA